MRCGSGGSSASALAASRRVPMSLRFAASASPAGLPGDLVRGEDRTLSTHALRRPADAHYDTAKARPNCAAHVLLHRHLEIRLSTGLRRPENERLPGTALAAQLRDTEPLATTRGETGERPEHARRSAGERLVGPTLVLRYQLGNEPAVTERPVVGRDDIFDLVGEEARRIHVTRACRPEEEHDLPA